MTTFALEHPWLTFFMFISLARTLRVVARGWPKPVTVCGDCSCNKDEE